MIIAYFDFTKFSKILIFAGIITLTTTCSPTIDIKKPIDTQSSIGLDRLVLTAVDYSKLLGWDSDVQTQVFPAFKRSCDYFTKLSPNRSIGIGGLVGDWLSSCVAMSNVNDKDSQAVRDYFETWFQPFLVSDGRNTKGLFTGYFEIELRGSQRRFGAYQVPLYIRPKDLPLDSTYYSRVEIEAGALRGNVDELLWVDDLVDAHILHIQGSGRVHLDNGRIVQVGYNGSNGHKFIGLGRILLDHGKITHKDTTMQTVRTWLKMHPIEAKYLMAKNPRYIFFRLIDGDGPVGAAGIPLTKERSMAVDPHFVPLGIPIWLDSTDSDGRPLRRLMVAQDSGAAIKGPVRGDIYFGTGEAAFNKAGRMKNAGSYYILLPKKPDFLKRLITRSILK
ncbi:MAG: MltA domain-containing protein [Rhodospirillaceae bacterium]|jgi:membrane-bound lytic murein transglycosylase A|nr:MltA domain-containing protein [Rhodospirillaceae bacterium]